MLTQIFLSLLFRSLSETKYFHLLFIAGLTCTLSFSSCFAHADFALLLSNSGENLKKYLIIITINICKSR